MVLGNSHPDCEIRKTARAEYSHAARYIISLKGGRGQRSLILSIIYAEPCARGLLGWRVKIKSGPGTRLVIFFCTFYRGQLTLINSRLDSTSRGMNPSLQSNIVQRQR